MFSDKALSKFMHIGDIIETVCELLPLLILQYINNEIGNNWTRLKNGTTSTNEGMNYFVYCCFIGQIIAVSINLVIITKILLDESIIIFWRTLFFLKKNSNDN